MSNAQLSKKTHAAFSITKPDITKKTVEEEKAADFALFQTDACMTVVSALSAWISELATKVCDMVEQSHRSEKREHYNIMRDYTHSADVLTALTSVRKAVARQNSAVNDIISLLTRNTQVFKFNDKTVDAGLDFISRVDVSDEEFAKDYHIIRKQITDLLRPFKCADPVMLYAVVNAIYMARRFDAMSRFVSGFAVGFRAGEPFNQLLHLKVVKPLELMLGRLGLTDKAGNAFVFIHTKEEREEWQKTISKKSWQKKHAACPPVVVDLCKLFASESLVRTAWQLETHMLELKTIDKLIAASEGHDPKYRNDYRQKRLQSCASTYEQAMLNMVIIHNRRSELPIRMRQFIDSVNARHSIDSRRKARPVVSFRLEARRDKKGNIIYDKKGNIEHTPYFAGIWNSAYEAEQETSVSWKKIRKSVELKAVNDGTNHIWLSIEDYISMTYSSLAAVIPELAEEFKRMLPEFEMQTTQQIAAESKVRQGTFGEAAV